MEKEGPANSEVQTDGERLAANCRRVLREFGVDPSEPDVADMLAEIASADPEETLQMVMDLMGNAGLEPDEAFVRVLELGEGQVEAVLPNLSQKIAAITGVLLAEHGIEASRAVEDIAERSKQGALGTATNLLVDKGVFGTTQEALRAIDPDASLRAEIESQV